jgi:hypothetical protein
MTMALIPKRTPNPWFASRDDYEAIRRFITDEPQLFDTYDERLNAANKRVEEFAAKGIVVDKVTINPQDFVTYCRASGIDHNKASLGEFTAKVYTTTILRREGNDGA